MTSQERRKLVLEFNSEQHQHPVSASAIAAKFGVSRQIIVGDIALLRASGEDISATPRGYVYQNKSAETGLTATIACQHDDASLQDELYTIVDNGGGVLDVTVEHPVYGQIMGQLQLFSRFDVDSFCRKLKESTAPPLSYLTGGIHLHTISFADNDTFERIIKALDEKGFLFEKDN